MKSFDKMLFGIVTAIALLVVVAFAVAWLRPKPSYQAEDTPAGVANNYLLALEQDDYARAYRYLSPDLPGYPASVEDFTGDMTRFTSTYGDGKEAVSVNILSTTMYAPDQAKVNIQRTQFNENGLFGSGESTDNFYLTLQRQTGSGEWKIIQGSLYDYWRGCWTNKEGCP